MRRHGWTTLLPLRFWIPLTLLSIGSVAPHPVAAAPDAAIAARVAAIDPARYAAHLAALEGQRFTPDERAAARVYIQDELESYGYTVQVDAQENVSAVRLGSITPSLRFAVGAHHDGVPGSPAADDNASGTAALLEIARCSPRASSNRASRSSRSTSRRSASSAARPTQRTLRRRDATSRAPSCST